MWIEEVGRLVIPALSGLLGVALGGWISARNERERRRNEFVSRQLDEFYGPLLSLRAEIKARSELRVRVQDAAGIEWRKKFKGMSDPELSRRISEESGPKYSAIIDDDNTTFREGLMPLYREMIRIFRERMWLADPGTRAYFPVLVEFVDIWDRYLRDMFPGEVIAALGHSEQKVHPLYTHIEGMCDQLRGRLSS